MCRIIIPKLIFLLNIKILLAQEETNDRFPNINYIAKGYDIFQGNPRSGGYDPGWKKIVFKFSYKDGLMSSDDKWEVPNTIDVRL